jgi:AraC-like DNA-binding protein
VIPIGSGETKVQRLDRVRVEVSGAVEIRQFLENTYGTRLRLQDNRPSEAQRLTHVRLDCGPFVVDDVHLPGEVDYAPDPLAKVAAVWATHGKVRASCGGLDGEAVSGEVTLVSQPDLPSFASTEDVRLTSVLMDPASVSSVAAGVPRGQAPLPLRFSSFEPVSPAAAKAWKDTVTYVKSVVLADEAVVTPLVVGNLSRLLASVALAAFPSTVVRNSTPFDRTDSQPVLLRRAIAFIDSNVAEDISLIDIAESIHVTPRAVQYMFRRHLDTTPLQYLRRQRLHYAHLDLLAADRMKETVTTVAARWGFAHTGRFAVLYRQHFGESPHTTLRS